MSHHEPIGDDEIFVGNSETPDATLLWLHQQGVKSARLGTVAYYIDGKVIDPRAGRRPIFIKRSESDTYHDVMMSKTFGSDWRRRTSR